MQGQDQDDTADTKGNSMNLQKNTKIQESG